MAANVEKIDLAKMTSLIRHEIANPLAVIGNSAYFVKSRVSAQPKADAALLKRIADIESGIQRCTAVLKDLKPATDIRPVVAQAISIDVHLKGIASAIADVRKALEAKPPVEEKLAKHLRIQQAEIVRADAILREVDLYFNLDAVKPAKSDLKSFIDEVLAARGLPPSITTKVAAPAGLSVSIDRAQMRRAVLKVLDNAAEAMPSGGTLSITAKAQKGQAVIEFADTGAGFAPEMLAAAFAPFLTNKERKLGLGLATARKIVELHQGRVEAGKASGGALVRLSLPLA